MDGTYLARASDSQCCEKGISTIAPVWCQDTLHEGNDVGAVEDIELGGVLCKDLSKCKLLDGASSVVWGVQGDVRRCGGWGIGRRRLDGDEALGCCCTSLGGPQAQVDLEKTMGFLGH